MSETAPVPKESAEEREPARVRALRVAVQAYLAKIGPRALTDEEARELYLIRIRHGEPLAVAGMIEILAREADQRAADAEGAR